MTKQKKTISLKVLKVFPHKSFDFDKPTADIALIKIEKFNNANIIPLNLEKITSLKANKIKIVGWGALSEMGFAPSVLRKAEIDIVDQDICEFQLQEEEPSETPYLDDTMFCAGDYKGVKDTCSGDSGGPVYYTNKLSENILIGVVSWGFGCAQKDLSGVYTDVSVFDSWIKGIISAN